MSKLHTAPFVCLLILSPLLGWDVLLNTRAQQPSTIKLQPVKINEGVALYNQGKFVEATSVLEATVKRDKTDGEAWYYLGLVRIHAHDTKKALKAFESAVKLRPGFGPAHTGLAYTLLLTNKDGQAEHEAQAALAIDRNDAQAHYVVGAVNLRVGRSELAVLAADEAIKLDRSVPAPYLLKSQALLEIEANKVPRNTQGSWARTRGNLTEEERNERRKAALRSAELFGSAATALESYLNLAPPDDESPLWREQLKTLQVFASYANEQQPGAFFYPWEVDVNPVVTAKPEPPYTEAARSERIGGSIILRAIFSSAGNVENILVLRSLPFGLTRETLKAASKIKFKPAIRDGRAVSSIVTLEYIFGLY